MLLPHRPERRRVRRQGFRSVVRQDPQVRHHHRIPRIALPAVLQQHRPDLPHRPAQGRFQHLRDRPRRAGGLFEGHAAGEQDQGYLWCRRRAVPQGGQGGPHQVPPQEHWLQHRRRLPRSQPSSQRQEYRRHPGGHGVQPLHRTQQY